MSSIAPTVIIQNAYLAYQSMPLFINLNLTLIGGKCTCLLGPSGVGKSSLLRLIAGLHIDETVLNNNQIQTIYASDQQPLNNRISYMAQTDLLMPWLTVIDNVLLGARLRGSYAARKKYYREFAVHLLEKVGLSDVTLQYPASLSGGMRQRAALVRTLIEDRPIVLMDEPFAAVDVITRLRLQELAAELLRDRTVLLVTHDPLEALRLGQHIYILAGFPAQLSEALLPPGLPPRDLNDSHLLVLQAELLQLLRNTHEVKK